MALLAQIARHNHPRTASFKFHFFEIFNMTNHQSDEFYVAIRVLFIMNNSKKPLKYFETGRSLNFV